MTRLLGEKLLTLAKDMEWRLQGSGTAADGLCRDSGNGIHVARQYSRSLDSTKTAGDKEFIRTFRKMLQKARKRD